jgi:hypothetical protein
MSRTSRLSPTTPPPYSNGKIEGNTNPEKIRFQEPKLAKVHKHHNLLCSHHNVCIQYIGTLFSKSNHLKKCSLFHHLEWLKKLLHHLHRTLQCKEMSQLFYWDLCLAQRRLEGENVIVVTFGIRIAIAVSSITTITFRRRFFAIF